MKKTMRKFIKRYANIKTLFKIAEIICVLLALYTVEQIGDQSDIEVLMIALKSLLFFTSTFVIQTIGAVVTRILYFNNMLKRRNVMRFFWEGAK